MSCYTDGTQVLEKPQSKEDTQREVKTQSVVESPDEVDGEILERGQGEEEEGLQFEWKDIMALTIAVIQVIFSRVVIGIGSFALVIYLLGKFWLKCW